MAQSWLQDSQVPDSLFTKLILKNLNAYFDLTIHMYVWVQHWYLDQPDHMHFVSHSMHFIAFQDCLIFFLYEMPNFFIRGTSLFQFLLCSLVILCIYLVLFTISYKKYTQFPFATLGMPKNNKIYRFLLKMLHIKDEIS